MEDCCYDAESVMRALVVELQQIHARDDLPLHSERLRQLFIILAAAIVEARKYQDENPDSSLSIPASENPLSDKLRIEMNRILHMEGGREVIEKTQTEALKLLENRFSFQENFLSK